METLRNELDDLPPSMPSRGTCRIQVEFLNMTDRSIFVTWSNYQGKRVIYSTLRPHTGVPVFTFAGHPWIFEDEETGDVMLAAGEQIFIPRPIPPKCVLLICITKPLYSLRQQAIHVIRDNINELDDVNSFELPVILLNDVKKAVNEKTKKLDLFSTCPRASTTP